MTINNLFLKVSKKDNAQIVSSLKRKDEEYKPPFELNQFEGTTTEQFTLKQLKEIEAFANNFYEFQKKMNEDEKLIKKNKKLKIVAGPEPVVDKQKN